MIQDQLANIVKKFKENQYSNQFDNKENLNLKALSQNDQNVSRQQFQKMKYKIKQLEDTIERMIIDGNKMHRLYEEIIYQSEVKYQAFKEEFSTFKCSVAEQKKESENLVQFLNSKIETLSRQIAGKQELYRDILEKYQFLEQKANEVTEQGSQQVKSIENQLARASMHHEEQRILSNKEIQQMKMQMQEMMNSNEELLNQNSYIKSINESLAHNIEYLKNRLYCQNNIIHEQGQEDDHLSLIELQKCEEDSISREEDRFTLQEIKMNQMNQSHEMTFNGEKQVLDLSQHYSKFNRTLEFLSKEKENYQFVITQSNERKSFVKRQTLAKNENLRQKTETISSKKEQELKKSVPRQITQIKQFKMQQPLDSINPYKAFFMLLTQCVKLNSPHFDKISHLDINYLYGQLLQKLIPYNLWQDEINRVLNQSIRKR